MYAKNVFGVIVVIFKSIKCIFKKLKSIKPKSYTNLLGDYV